MKIDQHKSRLELDVSRVASLLANTIPEQTFDAMSDYILALVEAQKNPDWRLGSVVSKLKKLYLYPNREDHNKLLMEIGDLQEELSEERINKVLESRSKKLKKLGEIDSSQKKPWLVVLATGIILFWALK